MVRMRKRGANDQRGTNTRERGVVEEATKQKKRKKKEQKKNTKKKIEQVQRRPLMRQSER
jgi:hypothetical protein